MAAAWQQRSRTIGLWLIVLGTVFGCAGRRITTAVEDQAFLPGSSRAPVVGAVKAGSPPAVAQREADRIEAPPSRKPPALEEERVTEQPVVRPPSAPAPPPAELLSAEISDVFFDFDQFAIRSDARSLLEANAATFKAQAGRTVMIEGHCDERGTGAYNLVLGERRARATKQYLQDLGVASSQIRTTSYGKERPFCTEHSEPCWQSNRRSHFRRP